jgi:lysozyme family protein
MSRSFKRSFKKLVRIEGGEINHPSDPGGHTNYGITEAVARSFGYEGDMSELPIHVAEDIYKQGYWDINNLDRISEVNEDIAFEVFEISVNCGIKIGASFLQRALNVFNKNGEHYDDIEVDGIIGDKTISAYRSFHEVRTYKGMPVLRKAINGQQASYYIRLSEKDPKYQDFTYGWIRKRT